jgi:hypothetical protein
MKGLISFFGCVLTAASVCAQAPVRPVIVSKAAGDGQVAVVEVKPHFVTAIRMPTPANSIAIGDPKLFQVEHSPHEPNVVFVKALTTQPAESNLLISTREGHETSLLVVSRGANAKQVDFVVKYREPKSFLIAPDYPSELVGQTIPVTGAGITTDAALSPAMPTAPVSHALSFTPDAKSAVVDAPPASRPSALDALLARQEGAPLPTLYGEHPGIQTVRGDHVRAGVSEVMDGGQQVIVLFSAVDPMNHAILLVPPQVELGGRVRRGKIFRHSEWTASEELTVEGFRLSRRRLGPGERADGVVMFERPSYKQSNETLFLRVAEAGAIDKPALVPIGFGVNKLRSDEANHGRTAK